MFKLKDLWKDDITISCIERKVLQFGLGHSHFILDDLDLLTRQ